MGEWREARIGDLPLIIGDGNYSSKYPTAKEFTESGIPFISNKDIKNGRINRSSFRYISEVKHSELKKGHIKENDIIVSTRANIGDIALVDSEFEDANINAQLVFLRCDEKVLHSKYLYHLLCSQQYYEIFQNHASGSAQMQLPLGALREILIIYPEIDEQKAIAGVLSSLDDKIDLLHRQNKTLEKLAETLFRQWFIESAQEAWREQPLGNLVTIKRGGSPRPIHDYLSDSGYSWLKISDATKESSPFIFEIKERIKEAGLKKTTLLKKGALVLSNSATPGIPKILQVDSCIHDGWLHFPISYFSNEFLYLLFKKIRLELISQGNGSVFTNLKTDILKEYKVLIPSEEDLLKFQESIKLLFEKILGNANQIRTLIHVRHALLPKLMSGEVRIIRGSDEA